MISNRSRSIHIKVRYIAFILLIPLLLSCGQKSSEKSNSYKIAANDSTYIVDIVAADYAYSMPSEIPSGWVTFRMQNKGNHEHHGIIGKFPDSLGYKKLNKMVIQSIGNENKFNQLQQLSVGQLGGPAGISPGGTAETTVQLEPGLYVFTCWLVAPDGKLHAEKGMQRAFKVTSEKSGATKPNGTIDITLSDYVIEIEDPIEAGDQIFNVNFQNSNNVYLAQLKEGQNFDELIKWMTKVQTPSEFTFLGGAENAPAGMKSTFKATLEPGRYALVTYGNSISGMAEAFTVPSTGSIQPSKDKTENSPVLIESTSGNPTLPNTLPVGHTPVTIKNTGTKGQQYLLYMLKKGATQEEFRTFFENAYVDQSVNPNEMENPAYLAWYKVIGPGQEQEFVFKVYPENYVLIGPLLPPPPVILDSSPWNRGAVHTIKGIPSK